VAEYIAEQAGFPPLLRLGVKDMHSIPGDYNYLLAQHRLVPDLITDDIINRLKK
jgi:transketolase C-terminal domain/subunit